MSGAGAAFSCVEHWGKCTLHAPVLPHHDVVEEETRLAVLLYQLNYEGVCDRDGHLEVRINLTTAQESFSDSLPLQA